MSAVAFNELVHLALTKLFTDSTSVAFIKGAIKLALLADQTFLIRQIGPFLFKFAKEIDTQNIDHFIKWDYEDQMVDWMQLFGCNRSTVEGLRDSIRLSITNARLKHSKLMVSISKGLLQQYCKFVQEERANKQKT